MCLLSLYIQQNYSFLPLKTANNHTNIYFHIYSIIIHKINRLNTQNKQRDGCQNKRAVGVSGGTGGNLFISFSFCPISIIFPVTALHLFSFLHLTSLLSTYFLTDSSHVYSLYSASSHFIFVFPFAHVLL